MISMREQTGRQNGAMRLSDYTDAFAGVAFFKAAPTGEVAA
jgi:hypothetical protein